MARTTRIPLRRLCGLTVLACALGSLPGCTNYSRDSLAEDDEGGDSSMQQLFPAIIAVEAEDDIIAADGVSSTVISVQMIELSSETPWSGEALGVSTTAGSLSQVTIRTNSVGAAVVLLTSELSDQTIIAEVTVTMDSIFGSDMKTVSVTFAAPGPVLTGLSANPQQIPADGVTTSLLTASVDDSLTLAPVPGEVVTFEATLGTLDLAADTDPAMPGVQVLTDASGEASVLLTSAVSGQTTESTVTAAHNGTALNTIVLFLGGAPIEPYIAELAASPTNIPADGMSTSRVQATVESSPGVRAGGVQVDFTATLGALDAAQVVTGGDGLAVVNLTSVASATTQQSTVTASLPAGMSMAGVGVTFQAPDPPPAGNLVFEAIYPNPDAIPADGASTCQVTAIVIDGMTGTPATGVEVTFTTDLGTLDAGADVNPGTPGVQVRVDVTGQAIVTLTSGSTPGTAQVTATLPGGQGAMTQVRFL